MHKLKTLACATATAAVLALAPLAVIAQTHPDVAEARLEGSVATAFALNRHLEPFQIQVEVRDQTAILTGTVENGVNRDLAEQVALSIEGIKKVDNQLLVDTGVGQSDAERTSLANRLDDATTTATVKSKLLWNRHTQGLDINVSSRNSVVTLTGKASSEAASQLAERLASNTHGVREVRNELVVSGEPGRAQRAQEVAGQAANEAVDVVSDAWIISKVKSSLLLSRDLDGLNITVKSRDGDVTLSGPVDSEQSKQLAIEIAQGIRGVNKVDAGALRVVR